MPVPTPSPPRRPIERTRRLIVAGSLIAILAGAVALRWPGLERGLRHYPDHDEVVFVDAARAMIRAGDLDHRFYEYPGLFIYLLAPALALLPERGPIDPAAYLAVRGVAAAFSVVSVALVFFLTRRLAGAAAGLLAAALMAVAPLELWTMNLLRSDVVLETFVLAALLQFTRTGERLRSDAWSGAAIGAAAAIKFTGVLIAPAFVAVRLVRAGPRWRGLVLAGAVSAAVWLALTPYALIRPGAFLSGVSTQTSYFYTGEPLAVRFTAHADYYVRALVKGMGIAAAPFALVGLIALRRRWREWLPLVVYPLVLIGVLATAEQRLARLALSALAPLIVLAGVGLGASLKRSRVLGAVLALVVLAPPLWEAVGITRLQARPSTLDRALDWIEAHVPKGARVLCGVAPLGLDPRRLEAVYADRLGDAERAWANGMDWVVVDGTAPAGWRDSLAMAAVFEPLDRFDGGRIEILRPRPATWRRLPLAAPWLRASTNAVALAAVVDGDHKTVWRTPGPQEAGTWIEVRFPAPQRLDRIELLLGEREEFARAVDLLVRDAGEDWRRPRSFPGRPATRDLVLGVAPPSQLVVLEPVTVSGLRLVLKRGARQAWSVAELVAEARVSQ